jgi:hypothetical protein
MRAKTSDLAVIETKKVSEEQIPVAGPISLEQT